MDASAGAARFFGRAREALLTAHLQEFLPQDSFGSWQAMSAATLGAGPASFETLLLDSTGTSVSAMVRLQWVDMDGRPALLAEISTAPEESHRYRSLYRNVPAMLHSADRSGKIIDVSDLWLKTLGYSREEVLGKEPRDFLTPASQRYLDSVGPREFTEDGPVEEVPYQFVAKDGSVREMLVSGFAELDERGEAFRATALLTDVLQLRETERQLRLEQERYRALYRCSPAAIHSVGPDGRVLDVSDRWLALLGYTRDEVIGRKTKTFLTEESRAFLESVGRRELDSESGVTEVPYDFVKKSGEVINVLLSAAPELGSQGKGIEGLAVITDVTAQKKAEQARRGAERELQRLTAILEATPDLVALADSESRVVYLNPAGREMLGLGEHDEIDQMHLSSFHPESQAKAMMEVGLPSAIEHGVWTGESELLHRDGGKIPVSQVLIAHTDPSGGLQYLSTIARNLAERLELESRLRQSQKMDAIGSLAGGIAHDFNNVLTVILGQTAILLEDDTLDGGTIEDLNEIAKAGRRAALLTGKLLAFSRKQVLQPQVLNLCRVLDEMQPMLDILVGGAIDHVRQCGGAVFVEADPTQIEQIILNLVINAADAMKPEIGTLTVEAKRVSVTEEPTPGRPGPVPGEYALLTVSDTGIGMDQSTVTRIFDPFFTTKPTGKGTGLGLSTVYGIVAQSNGYIDVETALGAGTTFSVYLPAAEAPRGKTGDTTCSEKSRVGSETILLAEDEGGVRDLLRKVLERRGYNVISVPNGAEALRHFQEKPGEIHLLITDVIMPVMTGPELAKEVRALNRETPVLFMSGYTEGEIDQYGGLGEAQGFIGKPFMVDELLLRVREILDRRGLAEC